MTKKQPGTAIHSSRGTRPSGAISTCVVTVTSSRWVYASGTGVDRYMSTSAAALRITDRLPCTSCSAAPRHSGATIAPGAPSERVKRRRNQPYTTAKGVDVERPPALATQRSIASYSPPGLRSSCSTRPASTPSACAALSLWTDATCSACASHSSRICSWSSRSSPTNDASIIVVSTVRPLTVPISSRSFHQRAKTVELKKARMNVTNDAKSAKKASQSWKT